MIFYRDSDATRAGPALLVFEQFVGYILICTIQRRCRVATHAKVYGHGLACEPDAYCENQISSYTNLYVMQCTTETCSHEPELSLVGK